MADPKSTSFVVYGLYDPRDGELRYIGKSAFRLRRLRRHVWAARSHREQSHKARWIRQLIRLGHEPVILVLSECLSATDTSTSERAWIAAMRVVGARLTNLTDGGEGSDGLKHTAAARAKVSVANRGRKHSLEARQRMSVARTGAPWTETQRKANEALWADADVLRAHSDKKRAWAASPDGQAWSRMIAQSNRGRRHAAAGVAAMARKHQKPVIDQHGTIYPSQSTAAGALGVMASNISHMIAGRRTHVQGYVFRLVSTQE